MKTRRSLRLEKNSQNAYMQSVLFPEERRKTKTTIVPESPVIYNVSSSNTACTAASVLETPDDYNSSKERAKAKESPLIQAPILGKERTSVGKDIHKNTILPGNEFDDSEVFDSTPDLNLSKRKGIVSILESEYSFAKVLITKGTKNSSMLPGIQAVKNKFSKLPTRRSKRFSLAETILPFDLNNPDMMTKKLSLIEKASPSPRRKLSSKEKEECTPSRPSSSKCKANSTKNSLSVTRSNRRESQPVDNCSISVSVNNSIVTDRDPNQSQPELQTSIYNRSRTASSDVTTCSFENSNLELTDANCKSNNILGSPGASKFSKALPVLHFSSSEDESIGSENSIAKKQRQPLRSNIREDGLIFRNFSTLSCKEYERKLLNKENISLNSDSPISNYNKNLISGELSPVNRLLLQNHNSLSPTQPASSLILQGVVAFVDVRSGAENRSNVFKEVLLSLGAEVLDKFTSEVSHVIFRDGSKSTYQRAVRLGVHFVSPLWVEACRVKEVQVSEALFPISSECKYKNPSLGSGKSAPHRKLKSMQPRELEEDVLVVEARLKRKRRLQSNTSTASEDVFTPPRRPTVTSTEDVNSPLFGIGHLVNPGRTSVESTSSESSEKSSETKELNTPLAARLVNKFFTPTSTGSPLKIIPIKASPLINNEQRKDSDIPSHNSPKGMNDKNASQKSRRFSMRLSNKSYPQGKNQTSEYASHGTAIERTKGTSNRTDSRDMNKHNQNTESTNNRLKNNHVHEYNSNDSNNAHKSLFAKQKFCNGNLESLSSSSSSDARSDSISNSDREADKIIKSSKHGDVAMSKSLPNSSQTPSIAAKRRRLHTVEIMEPSQDLIMPSTPPVLGRNSRTDIYSELRSQGTQGTLSQREQMKRLKGNYQVLPLPTSRRRCRDQEASIPGRRDREPGSQTQSSGLATITEQLDTPKGRFSLVPCERHSLEEFQTPRNGRSRRIIGKKRSPNQSLPSICVSSIHSTDIRSIYAIIKSLGGYRTTRDVDDLTTHVVCGSDRRTMNVLLGIARGCWILDVSWLYESLDILKWAPEEPFELFNFCPGAKISRIIREDHSETFRPSLFADVGRIYVSDTCSPPAEIIQDLLHNCGANICSTIRSADLIIGSEKLDTSVCQASVKWVLDSVQHWNLKKIDNYLL